MRLGRTLALVAASAAIAGCLSKTPEQQLAIWRADAVSELTWQRVEPHLLALDPGDDLRIFEAARRIRVLGRGRRAHPVVVIPSWISSLSGGAAGGLSLFGQLIGREQDRLFGSHVFGTVEDGRIRPRFQIFTQATRIGSEEFDVLLDAGAPGLGQLPRPDGPLFFRDLMLVATRPLSFPDATVAVPEEGPDAFYSQARFRAIEPILEAAPDGTDLMSLLALLGATFVTTDYGESHGLFAPGFLHTRGVRTRTLEVPEGVFKLRPFGWTSRRSEVVDRIAIFRNDRLLRVVPHEGVADWTDYLEPGDLGPPSARQAATPST